jgi:hypothetical protein
MPRRGHKQKMARMREEALKGPEVTPEPAACRWPGCTKMLEYPSVLCVYHTARFDKNGGQVPSV